MLSPAQVIPFLLHEDASVREHAVRYFNKASDSGPLTADHYWQAIDRFGFSEGSLGFLSHLEEMPQTDLSCQRLLHEIAARHTEEYDYHLQHAVQELDFDWLRRHSEHVLSCKGLLDHVREHLRQRLMIVDEPPARLWDRLMEFGKEAGDKYVGEFDTREADRLIEAITRNPGPMPEQAMGMMADPVAAEDWREIFAVQSLGTIRHQPAIDPLIAKLAIDADLLREYVQEALPKIGTVEVIEKISAFYPGKEWHVRLYCHEPIIRIKRPESESALLRMLEIERDDELRQILLTGLTELGSLQGLEQSRSWIGNNLNDVETLSLCESLLAVAVMNGVELPDAGKWKDALAKHHIRRESRMALLNDPFVKATRDNWVKSGISSPPEPSFSSAKIDPDAEFEGPPQPIRRETPKVGRNDRCPCGSGKKYKKCCLSKSG